MSRAGYNAPMRWLAVPCLLLLAPTAAAAQDPMEPTIPSLGSEGCDALCSVAWVGAALGGAALAIGDAVLLADGTIKAGHGHGLYAEGATLEVILGLAHLAPVAGAAWALATQDAPDLGFTAVGLSSGAIAAYLLIHGLWSLTGGRPPPSHFMIGAVPTPGGFALSIAGRGLDL